MRKYLFVIGFIVIVGTSYFANRANEYVVDNNNHVDDYIVEEPVEVYPEEWLKEAEEAKEAVLRRRTLEAESSRLEAEIKTLEEAKIIIDKELGTY